jgi:uncharacterized protein YbjT (DUF2867 family)
MDNLPNRTALVLGASGLIGSILTRMLLDTEAYSRVTILVRRPIDLTHPKLTQEVINFEQPDAGKVKGDDVFCCLGTTIKVAGSKEAFYKVDATYPYELAKLARTNGASQFLLVTAMGADAKAFIFYNRVKGEVEEKIATLNYDSYSVFRPSLLLGDRKEVRPAEKMAQSFSGILSALMVGPLKKYKPVEARKVAAAMQKVALRRLKGRYVFESNQLQEY